MLHLEPGDTVNGPSCPCCGRDGRSAFGFVHAGGRSVAFYCAWLDPHPDRHVVSLAISVGDWSPEGASSARQTVAVRFEAEAAEVTGCFLPPEESPYLNREALGRFLTVEEAGSSPQRPDFLRVAETIVQEDPEVNARLTS